VNQHFILDKDGLDGVFTQTDPSIYNNSPAGLTADTAPKSSPVQDKFTAPIGVRLSVGIVTIFVIGLFTYRAIYDKSLTDADSLSRYSGNLSQVEKSDIAALTEQSRQLQIKLDEARQSTARYSKMIPPVEKATSNIGANGVNNADISTNNSKNTNPDSSAKTQTTKYLFPSLFPFGSTRVKTITIEQKAQVSLFLKQCKHDIRFVGHTDNTGPEYFNRILGKSRATAVKEYLQTEIPPGHPVSIHTQGSQDSINANKTVKQQAENRRVTIICPG